MEYVCSIFQGLPVVVGPVRQQIGYLYNYRINLQELANVARELIAKRKSVNERVGEAKRNGDNILEDVTSWLKNVKNMIIEIDEFLNKEDHLKAGCSNVLFPNLGLRHRLSREAKKMRPRGDELLQKQTTFVIVSYRPKPIAIDAALLDNNYESFKLRDTVVEDVMKALKDSTIKMIGIYGQGGVGKTTLVKAVARKAIVEKLFNVVVMADITRTPELRKIQGTLADMLGLTLDDESEIGRAGRLRQRLKAEEEGTLVILDDLWVGLDLNMLGIPFNDDDINQMTTEDMPDFGHNTLEKEKSPDDYKSCKILLTSRSRDVLSREMDVKKNSLFPVKVMDEKDAEKLFNKVAGITDEDSELKSLSVKIANKCAKLPIALVTAGKALKNNKNKFAWEYALQQMEGQQKIEVLEPVELSTKLSYDHLQSEELKSIFLLCARMAEGPSIMDLVKYCIGLGIFQGVYTVKEARDRINTLIEKLKDSSLLSNTSSSDRVTMHDMVREAALSIASKQQHVFTMRYGKLDEWPDKDNVERYTTISLQHCDIIDGIPEGINCPRLKLFHVETKDPFLKIPDKLFKGMKELRVLILIGINLSSLPSSIKCLTKLRMLCLEKCVLGDNLSIIGKLKKLRVLSLSGSEFECLPSELRQLGELQLFDISDCTKLRVIPSNVMSSLNSLEELYMESNLIQWGVEGQTNQSEIACLAELGNLQQLKRLDMYILDVATLPRSLSFDKLDSYKIVIGDFKTLLLEDVKMPCTREASRVLALQLKKGNDIHFQNGIKLLFKRVEKLFLGELDGIHNVVYELNVEGFPCLKHLTIIKNSDIQYIINSMEWEHQMEIFPKLESVCLYKLESMEKICNCQLIDDSFHRLKTIKIKICGRLKNLFSFYMVRHLKKLETIEVSECDSLEEIVVAERQENIDNDDNIVFPQLHTLTLQSLPKLTSFYANDKMRPNSQMDENQLPNRGLEEISTGRQQAVVACLPLFNVKVSVPNLESLELSSIKVEKVWDDQPLSSLPFQNLTELNVKDCDKLKYLFSLSVAKSLVKLQSLFVRECAMMKDIFKPEDISTDEARKEIDIFLKLKKIEITRMKELDTIWHAQASLRSFVSLNSVIIKECKKLVTVFPAYMVRRFQSLGSLEVINCKSVEKIFDLKDSPRIDGRNETNLWNVHIEKLQKLKHIWSRDPQGILDFKNLQNVHVLGCPDLENLFPISVASGLGKLQSIRVSTCHGMKEIVAKEDRSNESTIPFKFPQLTAVALERLPQLRSFCQERHTIEFPALKRLNLLRCDRLEAFTAETTYSEVEPIISALEKVISNLEAMGIGPKEMKWLHDRIGNNVYRMHNIKALYLDGLKSMEILFWFLQRTPNLENLFLVRCLNKEMLPSESLVAHEKIGTVVRLKSLRLWHFHVLQNISFLYHPIIQRIEQLYVVHCPSLITLVPSSVSFTHLTYLEVSRCTRLKNLMTSSTPKSLVQLNAMKVTQCEMMEEIVTQEVNEEERENEIVFSKLKSLELVSLRNLTSFCSSRNRLAFKFPSLEKLILRDCLKMESFCEKITSIPNLQKVNVVEGEEGEKWYWEGDLNATIQKIFKEMVLFEYTQNLQLFCHPELEKVWRGQVFLPDNRFRNLKTLVVANCSFLSGVFLSRLLLYLKNLEELQVRSCSVEVIFHTDDTELTKIDREDFQLKILTLDGLPYLKSVWSKDPRRIISFPNLQKVVVNYCMNLETLFPVSMAENLAKLEQLEIFECHALVEIVGMAEAESVEESRTFLLRSLTSLFLRDLPRLEGFYPGRYTLECPNLNRLHLNCNKLDIFASEFRSHRGALGDEDLVEKVCPNLEKLSLNWKDTMMLSHGHFSDNLLHKLKDLELNFYDSYEAAAILPFGFLQKIPNLESLSLGHFNALEEMFPSQKPEDIDSISILARVRALSLYSLSLLSSIGLDKSWLDPLRKNLEDLQVKSCPRLTVLVRSSAVSFCNLKQLTISQCDGLVFLFSSSTAKSLVQLEKMIIEECKTMEQIVDESTSDEIIFEKLKFITLSSLSRLVSFCSGINAALQFPTLQVALINQCPKMKFFSQKVIRAPNFMAIQASSNPYDLHYYEDLNTTVQKLFQDRVAVACDQQFLKLGDYLELEEIWHRVVPIPDKGFSKLKSLVVEGCKFSSVIPFHLLPYLNNLEELEVRKCDFVKAIVDVKDISINDTMVIDAGPASPFSIPLKKLILEKLPNLEHIWNEDPKGIFNLQFLQQVRVDGCKSLTSLFPASMAIDKLKKLEVQSCEGLVEIVARDETEATTKEFVFRYLNSLTLWDLPELKYFYPGLHQLEWPQLNKLVVYHCSKLRTFQSPHEPTDQQALVSVEKVFPRLKELSLSEKDIMMFWHEKFENLLNSIKYLRLMCFHSGDSAIFPYGFLQKVRNTEKLLVGCGRLREIFPSQRPDGHHLPELISMSGLEPSCVPELISILGLEHSWHSTPLVHGTRILSCLKELELNNLPELISIGLEHSWHSIPQILETLEVHGCSMLIHLVPSTVSFSNLVDLTVTECHKLECLFTSSTAKSLILLKNMSIRKCKSMQEVVAEEGYDLDEDIIIFRHLKTLSLYSLPTLGCFYTGSSKLNFPCLQDVSISECVRMKIFCQGDLIVPKLLCDLNAGIRTAYEKNVPLKARDVQNLELDDLPVESPHDVCLVPGRSGLSKLKPFAEAISSSSFPRVDDLEEADEQFEDWFERLNNPIN